ncbi:MAG: trypsin-like peptidase domain-containing protein [Myxococcota bacterium]
MNHDDFWTQLKSGIVGVRSTLGTGTGFIASEAGLVVTNMHVVGYDPAVVLRSLDDQESPARIVWANTRLDIVVLAPERSLGLPLTLGDSRAAREGMPVVAIGHPLALDFTVTRGIISATARTLHVANLRGVEYLQTDAAINPGNSGGPLMDTKGRVLGVNTSGLGHGTNLSFAVPVHAFAEDLERLSKLSPEALADLPVVYHCVTCATPYDPMEDYCLRCGSATPYGSGRSFINTSKESTRAERLVVNMLSQLGYVPAQHFVGDATWRLMGGRTEIYLHVVQEGRYVEASARLVRLPTDDFEGFYRFLLTLNDVETGDCRLAIEQDAVTAGFAVSTAFLRLEKIRAALEHLMDLSEAVTEALVHGWGCELCTMLRRDSLTVR